MATIEEAIKRLVFEFTTKGESDVVAAVSAVDKATAGLTVTSQTQEKSAVSLEGRFASLERRFGTTQGQADQYNKIQKDVNKALEQNPALQDRANEVLAAASERFTQAHSAAGALNAVLDAGRGAALGYAAGIGPIGAVLGSFGPWGIAAAAGIGLVVNALDYMSEGAKRAGDEASHLKQFSDVTGLTVTQVRGVTQAGAELGIGTDQVSSSLEKFTFQLDAARKYGGPLYDEIRDINGGLAVQIASTRSSSDALDLLARAYNSTTDATTKAALARAAFGKGGATSGVLLGAIDDAGGVDAYSSSVQKAIGVTDEWNKRTAALRNENKSLESDLALIKASIYTEDTLERQKRFLQTEIEIAKAVRDAAAGKGNIGVPAMLDGEMGLLSGVPNTPAPPTSTGPDFSVRFANATKDIDAANAAAMQFTSTTDALTAAQAKADAAQQSLNAVESSGTASAQAISIARRSAGDTLAGLAIEEQRHIASLNGAATGEEILKQKTDALTAGFLQGKQGAEDYNRALHGDSASTFAGLEDQLAVLNAITGEEEPKQKKPTSHPRSKQRLSAPKGSYVRCDSAVAA